MKLQPLFAFVIELREIFTMNGTVPCNCHEHQGVANPGLPNPEDVRATLNSLSPTFAVGLSAADIPDPQAIPMPPAASGVTSDLSALIAIARNHPGLKITLTFG